MLKIIRHAFYNLAIVIGFLGLLVGGDQLVKYALEMVHDAEYNNYYDTHYLNEPEMIVLLSLILLVGVRIALVLDRGIRPANSPDTGSTAKKPAGSVPANDISPPGAVPETTAPPVESADEKLTRLLKQHED